MQIYIKKEIDYTNLMHFPIRRHCWRDDSPNGCWFYNKVEYIKVIYARGLFKTLSNNFSFELLDKTINIVFVFVDPLMTNNINPTSSW